MSTLLAKALEKAGALPLADEEAWEKRFAAKRDLIRRMARKPSRKTTGARRCRWTICFDAVTDHPAAVVIPCPRVVRGDGDTGGYHWGAARKRELLDMERRRA